jgi:putative tricarboxylic transport membrane protein
MLSSQGSLSIFWSNWLVGGIMTLGVILLLWPAVTWLLEKRRQVSSRPVPAPAGAAVVDRETDR